MTAAGVRRVLGGLGTGGLSRPGQGATGVVKGHSRLVGGDLVMAMALAAVFLVTTGRHSDFATTTVTNFALFTLLAVSLQLMLGFSNQASLTQAGVYGVGAYASVYVETKLGMPLGVALLVAVCCGALLGLLFALPLMRLREHFLAMATLAAQVILTTAFTHLNGLTGGVNGEASPDAHLNSLTVLAVLLAVDLAGLMALSHLRVSRIGRQILALKVDETMASSVGVGVGGLRVAVVVVSFAIAAGAGFMFTETAGFIAPDDFTLTTSLAVLVAVVLGGRSLTWGTLVGAGAYSILTAETTSFPGLSTIIIGIALVLILGYAPGGLTGLRPDRILRSGRSGLGALRGHGDNDSARLMRAPVPDAVAGSDPPVVAR